MPSNPNADTMTVSIGVLGKPATTTRTFTHQPFVWADGHAVFLQGGDGVTEIVDAATGETIDTYDRDELELDRVPKDQEFYGIFGYRFATDVTRGFLYLLSPNPDGVQLRRFNLDGSNETLLALLAPNPLKKGWYADLVLGPAGEVIATACPIDRQQAADFRCRLYQAESGEDGPITPRYLPLTAARPCGLLAAGVTWLVGTNQEHCRADGGPPQIQSYMALHLSTLKTSVVQSPSLDRGFGVIEGDGTPRLIANQRAPYPHGSGYPSVGVILRLDDKWFTVDRYYEDHEGPEPDSHAGYAWLIEGWGLGWTLLRGHGPEYAICQLEAAYPGQATHCPSGPVVLETPGGYFELPPGTWGEHVPPA